MPEEAVPARAPVLVLGLGNLLLQDDGIGLQLLAALAAEDEWAGIEFVDGGTQGVALLPLLGGRRALLVLDAIALGAAPGTVHAVTVDEALLIVACRPRTSHGSNARELLMLARLLDQMPPHVVIAGVEPGVVRTGIGLTREVEDALPAALEQARAVLREMASRATV